MNYTNHPPAQPDTAASSFERMFMDACADLGLINEALDLDPNEGGAEPILDAIESLLRRNAALKAQLAAQAGQSHGAAYGIIDPDYAHIYMIIRCLAWSEGYALCMHGSFTRDLDLVAVPWDAARRCNPEHLIRRIIATTGLSDLHSNPGKKPYGRLVWTLMLPDFGDPRFVDLSIVEAAAPQSPANALAIVQAALETAIRSVWQSDIEVETHLIAAEIAIRAIDKQSILDGMSK